MQIASIGRDLRFPQDHFAFGKVVEQMGFDYYGARCAPA